jgi:hypothetical protein
MDNAALGVRAGRTENDRRMFGFLIEIRAACQYLQRFMADTLKRASAMDAASAAAYVSRTLSVAMLNRVDKTVTPQLEAIQQLFIADVKEFEWCADYVVLVTLAWSQVKDLWPAADTMSDETERRVKQIDEELDQIIFRCVSLSLSPRVNDVLENLRTGQPLDVEFKFGAEFPKDPELRKRLILELAQESAVLECGIVDVDQGVVYKSAATRREQTASVRHLVYFLLLGFVIPILLSLGSNVLAEWPLRFTDLERLLADYVLILVGSGAHLAVEALKTAKRRIRPRFQAVHDWVLWLHVRESEIRNGIIYIWVGYLLLAFGLPKLEWSSAFFAGYSIDSVTELFLERFQAVVKTKTQVLAALPN